MSQGKIFKAFGFVSEIVKAALFLCGNKKMQFMKRVKNTGFRITIALNAQDRFNGNISTSTAHYMVDNLLKRHELYNTSIKEMPGIVYGANCNFFTTTILQVDLHSPDAVLPSGITDDLMEHVSRDVYVQRYEITRPSGCGLQ